MSPVQIGAKLTHDAEAQLATIELYDFIDPYFCGARELSERLKEIGDVERIEVLVHSRGGNAYEGMAMYTILAMHPATVHVKIIGLAASAASVICMAGDKVSISETGHFMIHDPYACICGNPATLRLHADRLEALKPSVINAYRRRTTASVEELSTWMSEGGGQGKWFDSEAAVAAGFCDEIDTFPPPQMAVRLDDLGDVPEAVMATFGKPPEPPKPESPYAVALRELGETPQQADFLAELFDDLGALETPTEAEPLDEADLEFFESLLVKAPAQETDHA